MTIRLTGEKQGGTLKTLMVILPNQRGFTIVELLIVIVVIAVLAVITVVAYNGVQSRSRASSLSSSLNQAKKKLELYKVENNAYPLTGSLAAAGLANTGSTFYQYTSDGTTYCITASTNNTSYNATNATGPTSGACSGQVSGGVITNLVNNPGVETNLTGYTFDYGGGSGTSVQSTAGGGQTGVAFVRMTWSTPSTATYMAVYSPSIPVQLGKYYVAQAMVRTSTPYQFRLYMRPSTFPTDSETFGSTVNVPANAWTALTATYGPAPASVPNIRLLVHKVGSGTVQAGNTIDVDSMMVVEGQIQHAYADGTSPNWSWNGTPNNSTSSGPPL